jgi:hypothetical protein
MRTEIAAAWRGDEVVGVVGLRPSIAFDADVTPEAVEAFLPLLESVGVGLVKSPADAVGWFWTQLGRRVHRRALVDRLETAYCVRAGEAKLAGPRGSERDARARRRPRLAGETAREPARGEPPDPFAGDIAASGAGSRRVPRAGGRGRGRIVFSLRRRPAPGGAAPGRHHHARGCEQRQMCWRRRLHLCREAVRERLPTTSVL